MNMNPAAEFDREEDEGVSEISPCGRFIRCDEVVGSGAFKVVYKGFDRESGTEVAWCQIDIGDGVGSSKSMFRASLLSEAALMESLEHENLTKCHSWWIDHDKSKINMITEFLNSGTLRQYRRKHKSVNVKAAIKNWGTQILKGLHYLHTRDPPVVHRDLKCDNIFVNGNSGQIKIGDMGLATLMQQQHHRLGSVVGTPEFMAPELYDEDYDQLVDIYAFGMCMLELITCEYPYSECKNVAQIFKKVITGVKPLALGKVKDPEIKELIGKCLVPASQRPSAAELLKDPFFSSSRNPLLKGHHSDSEPGILLPSCVIMPKSAVISAPDSQVSVSITSSCDDLSSGTSSVGSINNTTTVFYVESSRSTDQIQLRLRGKRIDSNTISFNLRVADKRVPRANCFEFAFDLEADDALKIALELVDGKDLTYDQVPVAVDLIDCVLLELEPTWKPYLVFHNQPNVASRFTELGSNWQFSAVVH